MKFIRGPDVPDEIWPTRELTHNTGAFDLLFGDKPQPGHREVDANQWINHPQSDRYSVVESSVKINSDCVMSLIWWKSEKQLTDLEDN